ncbi:MAG: hypothetical protein ACI9QQ_002460, partial [Myxococcota bacterium]
MLGLCVSLLPVMMGAKRPDGLGDVLAVRHWSYPN